MDPGTPPPQATDPRTHPALPGAAPQPCPGPAASAGKVRALARTFLQTVRHFFPDLNRWLAELPDTRCQPLVEYDRRFLSWWGILLFGLGLGSRRSADHDLRDLELAILHNLNHLAGTAQATLPVTRTLDHFLGHVGSLALAQLLQRHLRRLLRMKALDDFRFQGHVLVAVDGTGYLSFSHRHCPQCLPQKHASGKAAYLHPVLEAKLLTATGLALSLASEFIVNPPGRTPADYQTAKQDCELSAFDRLAAALQLDFPQLCLCLVFDSLYACGRVFARCRQYRWPFVVTFKEGRTPDLWREFQALLKLCPEQKRTLTLPDGTRRVYRWVEQLPYVDSEQRAWTLGAIQCEETSPTGHTTTFAWLTDLTVNRVSVIAIADQVGRLRVKIENEGFNVQKNSGLNLEHVFSQNWDHAKAYYYLLQLGHLLLQLLHHGSQHRALAKQYGHPSVLALWGALKKIPQRLLEALRYYLLPAADFDAAAAARCHIGLNSS